jgi:hypothetical protein
MNRAVNLPPISDEERQFLHYNPNTADLVDWVNGHTAAAIMAERARCAQIVQAEISRAESLLNVEDGGGPVFDREQTEAGIAALQTVASAIRKG